MYEMELNVPVIITTRETGLLVTFSSSFLKFSLYRIVWHNGIDTHMVAEG